MQTKHLEMEALAKRDVAGRLRTLATALSLSSDKTWLMRRARHLEQDAARLEQGVPTSLRSAGARRARAAPVGGPGEPG